MLLLPSGQTLNVEQHHSYTTIKLYIYSRCGPLARPKMPDYPEFSNTYLETELLITGAVIVGQTPQLNWTSVPKIGNVKFHWLCCRNFRFIPKNFSYFLNFEVIFSASNRFDNETVQQMNGLEDIVMTTRESKIQWTGTLLTLLTDNSGCCMSPDGIRRKKNDYLTISRKIVRIFRIGGRSWLDILY